MLRPKAAPFNLSAPPGFCGGVAPGVPGVPGGTGADLEVVPTNLSLLAAFEAACAKALKGDIIGATIAFSFAERGCRGAD